MMMNNKAFRSLFACLIALLLTVTIIPFAAFAAEDTAPDESADVVLSAPADGAAEDADAEDLSSEEKADDAAADATAKDDTATTGESEEESEEEPEENKLGLSFWISLGVLGALIIVGIVFAIIKRAKLKVWWGSIKSELKKIVWSSPEQVKKNSIVVIVFVVALAVAIGLLDFVFFRGIGALSDLL